MIRVIKRIEPFSLAKMAGLIYGLFAAVFIPLMMVMGSVAPEGKDQPPTIVLLILMVLYPIMAFLMGWVFGWIYNLCAGWTGGIRVELADE